MTTSVDEVGQRTSRTLSLRDVHLRVRPTPSRWPLVPGASAAPPPPPPPHRHLLASALADAATLPLPVARRSSHGRPGFTISSRPSPCAGTGSTARSYTVVARDVICRPNAGSRAQRRESDRVRFSGASTCRVTLRKAPSHQSTRTYELRQRCAWSKVGGTLLQPRPSVWCLDALESHVPDQRLGRDVPDGALRATCLRESRRSTPTRASIPSRRAALSTVAPSSGNALPVRRADERKPARARSARRIEGGAEQRRAGKGRSSPARGPGIAPVRLQAASIVSHASATDPSARSPRPARGLCSFVHDFGPAPARVTHTRRRRAGRRPPDASAPHRHRPANVRASSSPARRARGASTGPLESSSGCSYGSAARPTPVARILRSSASLIPSFTA